MTLGRGDRAAQRRRHKARYRGCWICGAHGECLACFGGNEAITAHGVHALILVVDGAFLPWTGLRHSIGPGAGGAGLVLALGEPLGQVIASRSCAFAARDSQDAEFQAVIRGARWATGVPIYTDCETNRQTLMASNQALDVRFLAPPFRRGAHLRAHELAVEGRLRAAANHRPCQPNLNSARATVPDDDEHGERA